MTALSVVTIVHGRRRHLELLARALERSEDRDLTWVVVAMDEPELRTWRPAAGPEPTVVSMERAASGGLPLAAARNAGARRALGSGAQGLVFLDVDCLPHPELVGAYRRALDASQTRDALVCGPVSYLPTAPPSGYDLERLDRLAAPHPARPAPKPGQVLPGGDHDLFWSLSFALRATTWRNLGGFHEGYTGYGAEDTDFAAKARACGVDLVWLGSAAAYHQYHPTEDPPRQHVEAILANARLFERRWGRWPMTGWLDAFVEEGLLTRADGGYALRPHPHGPASSGGVGEPAGSGESAVHHTT